MGELLTAVLANITGIVTREIAEGVVWTPVSDVLDFFLPTCYVLFHVTFPVC
jgi:hypothetical protein